MGTFFDFNLHSHTSRCGHAYGQDEEYVLAAMEAGFKTLGFSDHVFLPGLSQKGIRGEYSELEGYVSSVKSLQKKYEGQIDIHLGFEAEWYGDAFRDYYKELLSSKVEYLILGQHCFLHEGQLTWYRRVEGWRNQVALYASHLIEGMKSGLFLYVCHPDTFMPWVEEFDEEVIKIIERICQASLDTGVPLEINMGPSREASDKTHLRYPDPRFWEIAGRMGVKAYVGVDAHDPDNYRTSDYAYFEDFAKRFGVEIIKKCPLKAK